MQVLRGALLDGYKAAEDLDYLQLAEFTVEATPETALQLDGELCGSTPVRFRAAPFRLRVAA
jgi:diacylglycerol kinase family enzyme